jgi:ribosomal protein L15
VPQSAARVKVILSGAVKRAYVIKDKSITATKGAKAAIEAAGGRLEA